MDDKPQHRTASSNRTGTGDYHHVLIGIRDDTKGFYCATGCLRLGSKRQRPLIHIAAVGTFQSDSATHACDWIDYQSEFLHCAARLPDRSVCIHVKPLNTAAGIIPGVKSPDVV